MQSVRHPALIAVDTRIRLGVAGLGPAVAPGEISTRGRIRNATVTATALARNLTATATTHFRNAEAGARRGS